MIIALAHVIIMTAQPIATQGASRRSTEIRFFNEKRIIRYVTTARPRIFYEICV